jgi:two-component system response regulator FixJ
MLPLPSSARGPVNLTAVILRSRSLNPFSRKGRSCHRSNRSPNFRDLKSGIVLFPSNNDSNLMLTQPMTEIAKQVILVVDDDKAVRVSLRNMMESEGFEVCAFSNGHDLLNEASLPAIGCLIVDYHMPAMNGLELVSALRGRGVSIPAILITGNPTKYVRDRAAAVAVSVVEKPALGSYLLECVRDAVAKHAQLLS